MVRTAGERGAVSRGEQRFLQRLMLFGARGGALLRRADHRTADEQKGEQRGEDRADLLDEGQEPALIVESGRRVFDLYERALVDRDEVAARSEEHTSELQSLMRISYAVFCLTKKKEK